MPATYKKYGVSFQYPDNWTLTEETKAWPHEISIESPGGAFWQLHVYFPPDNPKRLAAEALRAMREEYNEVESEPVCEELDDVAAEGYDMSFFCFDFVVNCHARSFTFGDKTYLLMTQAEDREFDKLKPVFQAMTTSLLRSLKANDLVDE